MIIFNKLNLLLPSMKLRRENTRKLERLNTQVFKLLRVKSEIPFISDLQIHVKFFERKARAPTAVRTVQLV